MRTVRTDCLVLGAGLAGSAYALRAARAGLKVELLSLGAPLPANSDPDDYRQFVLGQDISYARGHFQLWAEAFEGRFEVPRLGDADIFAYYV